MRTGSNPEYTRNYLDALMQAFINYDRETRTALQGTTLASITDQMQTLEQELKVEQDALLIYERTNDLGILQDEQSVAGGYLEKLRTQLSDLELENKLLTTAETDNSQAAAGGTNQAAPSAILSFTRTHQPRGGPAAQGPESSTQLEVMKMERADLAKYLDPKSEKLKELDDQIKRAEDLEKATAMYPPNKPLTS